MAITEEDLERRRDDDSSVGPLEAAIEELAKLAESKLRLVATAAGSYLMGYARYLGLLFIKVYRLTLQAWLIALPYFALGAIGEYLLGIFPFYTIFGVIGLFMVIGPAALTAMAIALLPQQSALGSTSDTGTDGERHLDVKMFVIPLTTKGYRFWSFGVVGGALVTTLVVEVGWLAGIQPLSDIHDTALAFPNVWPFDQVVNLAMAIASSAVLGW